MDKKELVKQLKQDIIQDVASFPGIKPSVVMAHLKDYLVDAGFDILGTIDNMVTKGLLLEILYILPNSKKQVSMLFPIGTTIIRPRKPRVKKEEKDE